jgi:CHAT domain-containing protein
VDQQSGHLSNAEIEQYGDTVPTAGPEAEDRRDRIEAHLADCPACRERVLSSQRARLALLATSSVTTAPNADRPSLHRPSPGGADLKQTGLADRSPDCPDEDDLRHLAAGLCPLDQAPRLTQHASQCDHCGPLLRMYVEDFSDEVGKEDEAVLGKLKSASAGWQKKVVHSHLVPSKRNGGRTFFTGRWSTIAIVGTGLAAIAMAVVGLNWVVKLHRTNGSQDAQKLVALAYAERRTTEMRLSAVPHSDYNPIPIERSGRVESDTRMERPSFLDAEHAVAQQQRSGNLDGDWLEVKGRVELLEATPGSADRAVREFERARSRGAENPGLQIDLAAACFERERYADKPDLRKTLDLLAGVLKNQRLGKEDRLVALFDLAIVYEKLQAWDLAAATWTEYLATEPEGLWADEARQRLKSTQDRMGKPPEHAPDRSPSPASLLVSPESKTLSETERYQETALRRWLVPAMANREGETAKAIDRLAKLIEEKQSDRWLADFQKAGGSQDLSAVAALQSAIDSNARGHHEEALRRSVTARSLFAKRRNLPGRIRAQYEQVYALQRLLKASQCSHLANVLLEEVSATPYHWIQAQLFLEKAICDNLGGQLTLVDANLNASMKRAQASHFPVLALRVVGIAAGIKRQEGKYGEAWQYGVDGLSQYWQGANSSERLYQFYTSMELCAQETGFLYAAEALGRHGIAISENGDDKIRLGAARLLLADLLMGQGSVAASETEVKAADLLLQTAPDEPSANTYRLMSKIRLARLELRRDEVQAAAADLEPARSLAGSVEDRLVRLDFHTIDGTIQARLGHLDEGQKAYLHAVAVAEESLRSVKGEYSRLKWIKASDQAYRGLVRILLERHKQRLALEHWEWYKSRHLTDMIVRDARESQGPSLEIQAAFRDSKRSSRQGTHLIYAVFDDGVQMWVVGEKSTYSNWTPVPKNWLRSLTEEFSENCATPKSSLANLQEQGRRLFDLLVQPVVHQLPSSLPLIVEVDDPLTSLPLEALRSPEGWYVGERYGMIYSPGILQERRLRQPRPFTFGEHVLILDSGSVPGHQLEQNTIRAFFGHTTILDSRAESWPRVLQLLAATDIFHFVGHGAMSSSGEGLVLASEQSMLSGSDFAPRSLRRMRLAVLATCSSGAADDDGLLDTSSLGHAFLAAGVPEVITSRWNVDSETTAQLMSSFYKYLYINDSAPSAMLAARRELVQTKGHPYLWAGFTVAGRL